MNRFLRVVLGLSLFLSLPLVAEGVRLPLHSLRDQSHTSHCWAYAMSHMLESRALFRGGVDAVIDIERDTKYWVDYERLMAIFKSKNNEIYFGENEGGWQIEYWNAFLKHGKSFHKVNNNLAQILYPVFEPFHQHLDFMPGPTNPHDSTLPTFDSAKNHVMTNLQSSTEVEKYALDFLGRYYGEPAEETKWLGETVALNETAEKMMDDDFADHNKVDDLVLVKPVTDGDYKWVKYLGERFWGYRYDKEKVLQLVQHSLDNGWPVTFDNVYHAMTILGYDEKDGMEFYAVADSSGGSITWYESSRMLSNLNLVSFFKASIEGQLPVKPKKPQIDGINYDKKDGTTVPPQ